MSASGMPRSVGEVPQGTQNKEALKAQNIPVKRSPKFMLHLFSLKCTFEKDTLAPRSTSISNS